MVKQNSRAYVALLALASCNIFAGIKESFELSAHQPYSDQVILLRVLTTTSIHTLQSTSHSISFQSSSESDTINPVYAEHTAQSSHEGAEFMVCDPETALFIGCKCQNREIIEFALDQLAHRRLTRFEPTKLRKMFNKFASSQVSTWAITGSCAALLGSISYTLSAPQEFSFSSLVAATGLAAGITTLLRYPAHKKLSQDDDIRERLAQLTNSPTQNICQTEIDVREKTNSSCPDCNKIRV